MVTTLLKYLKETRKPVYEEMANYIAALLHNLNEFSKVHENEDNHLIPYMGKVEVMMEGEVIGYCIDEVGGSYMYIDKAEYDRRELADQVRVQVP